jgi:hypothetical protein
MSIHSSLRIPKLQQQSRTGENQARAFARKARKRRARAAAWSIRDHIAAIGRYAAEQVAIAAAARERRRREQEEALRWQASRRGYDGYYDYLYR